MKSPPATQRVGIYIRTLIEACDTQWDQGFHYFFFCCIFGLKSMEQNELGIAIYAPREEKYIILPFLMLVLGTVAFVYGKRQESEKHYFNSAGK